MLRLETISISRARIISLKAKLPLQQSEVAKSADYALFHVRAHRKTIPLRRICLSIDEGRIGKQSH